MFRNDTRIHALATFTEAKSCRSKDWFHFYRGTGRCGLINLQLSASCKHRGIFQTLPVTIEKEEEKERGPADKNQLECHVDGWRAYFPVVVRTISRFHGSPIVVLPCLALAPTFRERFLRSVNERRTADRRKTRLPSSLSRTWVTWRRIGRRFIARSCTTCTTTTAAVRPTGCEIRSLTIDESRTNVTSSLNALSSLAAVNVPSNAKRWFFCYHKRFTFRF